MAVANNVRLGSFESIESRVALFGFDGISALPGDPDTLS